MVEVLTRGRTAKQSVTQPTDCDEMSAQPQADGDKGGSCHFSGSDILKARAETPGVKTVLHFNNAGSALMPTPVLEAQLNHIKLEAEIGGYEAAALRSKEVENVYDSIAKLINCNSKEVAVIENATRAWDMAFYAFRFRAGDRILTAASEYSSNYIAFLQIAQQTGAVIEVIPSDENGQISLSALRSAIDDKAKLIAITHVPTNGGLVNPAAEIGAIAREAGVPFILDACQSVGHIPIDVEEIGCDILSATSRKYLRGPRGTGFLYVRESLVRELEPPLLDNHAADWISPDQFEIRGDARRFETWETNYAAKIGLGVAVDYALTWGMQRIRNRIYALADELRHLLADLAGVIVHDLGKEKCGIVSFSVDGHNPYAVKELLSEKNINVSVSRRSSTLLDMTQRNLQNIVRASVHYYNSEEEIHELIESIARLH